MMCAIWSIEERGREGWMEKEMEGREAKGDVNSEEKERRDKRDG